MIRIVLFLTVCLLSCREHSKTTKLPVSDSTAALYTEKKAALDQLFLLKRDSAAFHFHDLWTSLLVGYLFDQKQKDAVLRYQESDTVTNVIVLRQSGKNWDTILSAKVSPVITGYFDNLVEVSDFNGDDVPDLKVITNYWDIHIGENSSLWLYSKNHFEEVKGFDSIVSATYDKRTNLIYSYQSTACSDMAMYFGVFSISGTKVKRIKEVNCDCCYAASDSCTIEVLGQKPFLVPCKLAYKYVPAFFAEAVKEKCDPVAVK